LASIWPKARPPISLFIERTSFSKTLTAYLVSSRFSLEILSIFSQLANYIHIDTR
jgi:hypothetical protein